MRLFEPGSIGKLYIKNRIVMAPMGVAGLCEPDGRLSQRAIDYYVARAKGGTGLIITCVSRVSRQIEHSSEIPLLFHPMVDHRMYICRLSELADAVHDYGAKIAMQLTAGYGRVSPHWLLKKIEAVGPSRLPCFSDPTVFTRELNIQEIEDLVESFKYGAEIVSAAGIDAIELHAHEGYLFDQFQTSLWNKRTDKYGGNLDGRLTFAREVIEAIKKGAGADFPVIYRFGLTHHFDGGRKIDEGIELAGKLETAGVDALHVDAGCYETWYWPHPPTYLKPGCMVDMAERVKKEVKIPVIAVGKLGYPELAERVLRERKADFVALGRALLADPEWPNKVKEKKREDICPCIGDHEGCMERVMNRKYISCTVNPMVGMEREFTIKTAKKKRTILIVGGGPAGMEAAIVAAQRGHEVRICEKSNSLGGNLIPASVPNFKQDYKDLINYLIIQLKKLDVSIEFGRDIKTAHVKEMNPDAVIIATGATPFIPPIPGIENPMVVTAPDLLLGKKKARDPIVVIGGGLVGCETALYLAQKGWKLILVEMLDFLSRDSYSANYMYLLKLLSDARVEILTGVKAIEIMEKGLKIADKEGKSSLLTANTIVLAVGLRSNNKLWASLEDKMPNIYAIGDCVEPRRLYSAIWEGFRTARLI